MLTNMFKTVDKLWTKYTDTWTCESCKVRDIVVVILILLLILL